MNNHDYLAFLTKKLDEYKIFMTSDGVLIDKTVDKEIRANHLRCIIKNDCLAHCQREGLKFHAATFNKVFDYLREVNLKLLKTVEGRDYLEAENCHLEWVEDKPLEMLS